VTDLRREDLNRMAIVNVVLRTRTGDPKMVSGMGRVNNDPVFR
jgi:hypothetical protein